MLIELFIFGLLCNTACPLSLNAESSEETANSTLADQKICADQIEWIENKTLAAKQEFAEYYTQLAKNRVYEKSLGDVNSQLDKINQLITDTLEKYTVDLDKVFAVSDNVTNQLNVCIEVLEKFNIMSQNLSSLMRSFRPTVIGFAKKLGLSPNTIDGLDRSLGRMVMFTTELGNHTVEHKFINKGVKSIIRNSEEGEVIGHTEGLATDIVEKQANTPEGVPDSTTEAAYDELEDAEDEKAFDDLINNSNRDIEKADKELLDREQQMELAEREHLAEDKLLEREEAARIQQVETNEIFRPLEVLIFLL